MSDYLLQLEDVHTYIGMAHILRGLSLALRPGEAVALLGRNGEGKTPTIKTIMSLLPPRRGTVLFQGENIAGAPTHQVASKGICVVPKGRHIFPALTVMEHLRVPVVNKKYRREDMLKQVFAIFPELAERKNQPARSLSGGQQQMLVIARALMTKPRLLLLDEPMEGLAPVAVKRVIESMKAVKEEGITVFFASASCERALAVAGRVYIIEKGRIVYEGSSPELMAAPEVQQKYLGVRE
ncbi:MAG: ABC transporter ATP-binding protein [Desulfarculus sp.]|jgi:branched-chain amino acid transport system ATP-binding protein|nr:MAG: ABC transporter ATP-binding protein [Desulfarculus sp.]